MPAAARKRTPKKSRSSAPRRARAAPREPCVPLSSDWYWEQDAAIRFTRVVLRNADAAEQALARRLVGKARWETGIDIEGGWDAHRAVLEARKPFHDVLMWRTFEDGRRRYVSVSGEPTFDARGRFTGYRGVGRDITAQKRAERLLRESEARFRSLTHLSSDWYWEMDAEHRFTRLGRAAEQQIYRRPVNVLARRLLHAGTEMSVLALDDDLADFARLEDPALDQPVHDPVGLVEPHGARSSRRDQLHPHPFAERQFPHRLADELADFEQVFEGEDLVLIAVLDEDVKVRVDHRLFAPIGKLEWIATDAVLLVRFLFDLFGIGRIDELELHGRINSISRTARTAPSASPAPRPGRARRSRTSPTRPRGSGCRR